MIQGMCKSCCARHSGSTVNIIRFVKLSSVDTPAYGHCDIETVQHLPDLFIG